MLVEEYKDGPTTVKIYDDYICSKEESIEILQRVADNILRQLNAQERRRLRRERQGIAGIKEKEK